MRTEKTCRQSFREKVEKFCKKLDAISHYISFSCRNGLCTLQVNPGEPVDSNVTVCSGLHPNLQGRIIWVCVHRASNFLRDEKAKYNGLFQKISTHPYGRHWIGSPKISGFPRRTTAVFAGFQSLLFHNLDEFQNFARFWMVFLEFRSKFTKLCGNSWISNVVHGCVWIFSGIAQSER